ncbi:MAG: indolepyruvate ferredoxin oxidoreductase subunit alpha [Lachnospiraceae bacterium]|nr:indolepyruvate ferredoxin oxidoreductase subunit alpha [Lachnospiraceae bacterium]
MHKEILMGNEAIALGAIAAGVNVVSGYPGTPSTEVLETVAKRKTEDIYVEWSVNEKAGLEVAAGAAYAGGRALVTMKQVGLNVATDPLMSLEYVGIKGGLVLLVADDPGPISSQTEQDTRTFGMYSKVPVFDPSTVEEAYHMIGEAFELSEKYGTPVILRSTTRVSHGYASIEIKDEAEYYKNKPDGFIKDTGRWVIFPRLAYNNHKKIEERNASLKDEFSDYKRNFIVEATGDKVSSKKGIATHGISYTYTMENINPDNSPKLLKVSTPFPFPEKLAVEFLTGLDEVLCIEELDPVIERALIYVCGKYGLNVKIKGKLTGDVATSGENSVDSVKAYLAGFFGEKSDSEDTFDISDAPALPVRPPVLCAGCPHRASFYAVKQAMKGKKAVFSGDIGCYTLGNAKPLDMTDTCLCMGAGFTIPQGIGKVEPDTYLFGFVGDSTFFASGITGVVNAYYNQANITLCILDNSTTAMTGHQPHPGTGRTMMGEIVEKVSIEKVLKAIGLTVVETVDPLDNKNATLTVKRVADEPGVKAIIFKSPCVALFKPEACAGIDSEKCIKCKKCINEIGCPAIAIVEGQVTIDTSLCTGCGLCAGICPVGAISTERNGGGKNA